MTCGSRGGHCQLWLDHLRATAPHSPITEKRTAPARAGIPPPIFRLPARHLPPAPLFAPDGVRKAQRVACAGRDPDSAKNAQPAATPGDAIPVGDARAARSHPPGVTGPLVRAGVMPYCGCGSITDAAAGLQGDGVGGQGRRRPSPVSSRDRHSRPPRSADGPGRCRRRAATPRLCPATYPLTTPGALCLVVTAWISKGAGMGRGKGPSCP